MSLEAANEKAAIEHVSSTPGATASPDPRRGVAQCGIAFPARAKKGYSGVLGKHLDAGPGGRYLEIPTTRDRDGPEQEGRREEETLRPEISTVS